MQELNWCNERPRPDGEINRCTAFETVSVADKCRIELLYSVVRGPLADTDDRFSAVINFPNGKSISREVGSMSEGKAACEESRIKFWRMLAEEMQRTVGTL